MFKINDTWKRQWCKTENKTNGPTLARTLTTTTRATIIIQYMICAPRKVDSVSVYWLCHLWHNAFELWLFSVLCGVSHNICIHFMNTTHMHSHSQSLHIHLPFILPLFFALSLTIFHVVRQINNLMSIDHFPQWKSHCIHNNLRVLSLSLSPSY